MMADHMQPDQAYIDERQAKAQGRWATAFSVFSAISLILVAAFGPQIAAKLSIPAPVTYTLAGIGGALTLLLNLGADLRGFSRRLYLITARAFAIVLVALSLLGSVFSIVDAKGVTNQSAMAAGFFLFFGLATLVCLRRLCAVLGHPADEDEEEQPDAE